MKNHQEGFVAPLLVTVIAVLLFGGGIYLYMNGLLGLPVDTDMGAAPSDQIEQNDAQNTFPAAAHQTTQPAESGTTVNNTAVPGTNAVSGTNSSVKIEVAGMKHYTDSDFGFSFWYPAKWQVVSDTADLSTTNLQGGSLVKRLYVKNDTGTVIWIQQFHSPTFTITDSGGAGPHGPITYYFNPSTHSWMVIVSDGAGTGIKPAAKAITTFVNTMGGLHMFGGTTRFDTMIIPLSAQNFVVISDGGEVNSHYLSNTVVALDPSVATPVSQEQQIKIIQAEGVLYGITATRVGSSWYVNGEHVYDGQGYVIVGANPATFKTINVYSDGFTTDGTAFATDGMRVYSGWSLGNPVLAGADPATFVPIRQQYQISYAQNSGRYGQSFTSYSTEFAKDKSYVWYTGKLIPGADPSTFVITGNTHVLNSTGDYTLAHDANHTYGIDVKGSLTIDGVTL